MWRHDIQPNGTWPNCKFVNYELPHFFMNFIHNFCTIRQALVTCHFPASKCNLYFLNTQVYDNESIFVPRQHSLLSLN